MARMSKSVSLVLIGSSLILAGCGVQRTTSAKATDKKSDQDTEQEARPASGSGGHASGVHYHPWYYGRSYWAWGGGSAAPSGRAGTSGSRPGAPGGFHSGGFGSSGHAVGS
jgi:hypothetical protein